MLSGVQMRGEVPSRVPGSPLDGSRLSRSHSEDFGRWYSAAEARRRKGKDANAALLPGVCECWGGHESRSGEDVEDDDSGVVCSSRYLSREADQDAICAGGRLDRWRLWRAVLMRRPRVAACCVERGRECGSVRLSSRVGLPACLPACPSAVCRVLSRSLALTDFLMCVAGVALVCRGEVDSLSCRRRRVLLLLMCLLMFLR